MKLYPWQQLAISIPEKIALQDDLGRTFTWQEVDNHIQKLALSLHQQGVNPHQHVALCGKNSPDLLFLYLSIIQLGAVVLVINPAFKAEKISNLIHQLQINFIYFAPSNAKSDLKAEDDLTDINWGIPQISPHNFEHLNYSYLSHLEQVNLNTSINWLAPATFTLTSGSSGMPKAVVHNVKAHWDNAKALCELLEITPQSRYLLSLPLYHISGQAIVWRWLQAQASLQFPNSITADFYADLNQATHASLVSTQALRWLEYLGESRFHHPKHILLGGSQIPENLPKQLQEHGIYAYCGYGMTEMASTVFAKRADHGEPTGVGQLLLDREFQIIEGEIQVRGAGLALGYWQRGEIVSLVNKNEFFPTKDCGIWQNNELFVYGRLDNQFISGGENIQPEEIERAIKALPLVRQCIVLPRQDPEFGERPVVVIAFEGDGKAVVKSISQALSAKLEKFKHPVAYYQLNEEKYGGIKISRRELWEDLVSGALYEIV